MSGFIYIIRKSEYKNEPVFSIGKSISCEPYNYLKHHELYFMLKTDNVLNVWKKTQELINAMSNKYKLIKEDTYEMLNDSKYHIHEINDIILDAIQLSENSNKFNNYTNSLLDVMNKLVIKNNIIYYAFDDKLDLLSIPLIKHIYNLTINYNIFESTIKKYFILTDDANSKVSYDFIYNVALQNAAIISDHKLNNPSIILYATLMIMGDFKLAPYEHDILLIPYLKLNPYYFIPIEQKNIKCSFLEKTGYHININKLYFKKPLINKRFCNYKNVELIIDYIKDNFLILHDTGLQNLKLSNLITYVNRYLDIMAPETPIYKKNYYGDIVYALFICGIYPIIGNNISHYVKMDDVEFSIIYKN
jgi:hypothetical protein